MLRALYALAGATIAAVCLFLGTPSSSEALLGPCPQITAPGIYDGQWTITRGCGVTISANDVVLRGYFIQDAPGAAITINGGRNIIIEDTWIRNYNATRIEGEQYNAGIACWNCERLTVRRAKIIGLSPWGNGIWLKRTTASTAGADRIENNFLWGGYDGIGSEPEDHANGGFGDGTIIQRNAIRNCADDGIQTEGRVSGVLVLDNTVSGCGTGVAAAPVLVGPLTVQANDIRDLRPGLSTAFFCFKLGDKPSGAPALITFRDNVCVGGSARDANGEGPDGFKQTNSGMAYTFVTRDNCIDVGRYVIEMDAPSGGADMDFDFLRTSDSTRFAKWDGNRVGLSGLQALGLELNARSSCE